MAEARTLMIQGTASSVGKSLLVTALCRYYRNLGVSVAPFKALNMALNAHVTADGGEIARAQAVQAEAAGIEPVVEMNPVLLKPEGDSRSQLVLMGKAHGVRSARELFTSGVDVRAVVLDALASLRRKHDLVVIEGAGSPAEINLRARDVANMFIARSVSSPVLLAGDIDRGGVFAAFVGTLELLEPEDRARIRGFIVNKFRGDASLLAPGLDWLRSRTGIPVAGVVPHLGRLRIAEEDSLNVDARARESSSGPLTICVLRLPRISNHDEFQPFEHEPDVALQFTDDPVRAVGADLVIVPGSKSTVSDLSWLRARGFDHVLRLRALRGEPVFGVCGGCQMLGESIADPHGVESSERAVAGLGLLALSTVFGRDKRTRQVLARPGAESWLCSDLDANFEVPGYYIHAGITTARGEAALNVTDAEGSRPDGAIGANGAVIGSMVHGLFEHDGLRHALLAHLRARKGSIAAGPGARWDRQADYDRLADAIATHCDTRLLQQLLE